MKTWRAPLITFYDSRIKRGNLQRRIRELRDYYNLPLDTQLHIQQGRLCALLDHAAQHVPYYREVLHTNKVVSSQGFDSKVFQSLPLLTKDLLRSRFDELSSDDLVSRKWFRNHSGGSTGEPVALIQDEEYADFSKATTLLHYEWVGLEMGQLHIKLWGSQRDILNSGSTLRSRLDGYFRNLILLNSFKMEPDTIRHYARLIQERRPALVSAYADSIYELADFIIRNDLPRPEVGAIITSAGTLFPFMRSRIQEAFGCSVFNRYGSRELGDIAGETRLEDGLEVFRYTHYLEVLNADGDACDEGEEGDIVVTSLTNYAMPFIRYHIGDRAIVKRLADCGSVQVLKTVTGRSPDCFVRQDGTVISGLFFIHFLGVVHNSGWVKKVQVIQEDFNDIIVKLVPFEQPTAQTLEAIRDSIRHVMGESCRVRFEYVDEIPPLASGKFQYTVSKVWQATIASRNQ